MIIPAKGCQVPAQSNITYLACLTTGKLSREKTFMNFTVLWLYAKFSPRNLGCDVLWRCKSEQSAKVFSAKIIFPPIRESFLPRKFPAIRYMGSIAISCDNGVIKGVGKEEREE